MSEESEICTICLEDLDNREDNYALNCNHKFHRDCITRWLHTSPNCPLCREPVDADHRYVDDGIMSEERREYIEALKKVCLMTAECLEWLFPTGLQGYTEKATQLLESEEGQILLDAAGENEHSYPRQLLLALGASGLTQFIANGGLMRLVQSMMSESPPES